MAYVALYRKWRPQGFDALVGQEAVRIALSNALATNRIAHAYLFAGPRGTGKTSTAKILAKALNCDNGPTAMPCNECPNCQRINDGSSMDVFEIDAASNRGIDEIRDLREKVMFAPVNGRYKVYIIDEVHMLTTEAFNALLKTLEEPPSHVVFILATTEPHKIPATIHSRCQRFDFKRVKNEDIVKRLREVADGSAIQVDDEALQLIAIQSDGGMRDALSLLDQCGVMAEAVTADTVRSVLGIVGREALRDLVKAIGSNDLSTALQVFNKLAEQGKDVRQIVTELTEYLRAVLLYKASPTYHEIYLTDTEQAIAELAPLYSDDRLMAAAERLHQTMSELRFSVRGRITAELCLFDLCRVEGSTLAALTARVEQLEVQLAGKTLTAVAPKVATEVTAPLRQVPPERPQAPVVKTQEVEGKPQEVKPQVEPTPQPAVETTPVAEKPLVQQETPKAPPQKVAAQAVAAYSGDWATGEDLWKQTLEIMKSEKKQSMIACAASGTVLGYDNNVLTVGFKNKFNCKRMVQDDYKTAFEEVMLRLARISVRLDCIEVTKTAPKPKVTAQPVTQTEELEPVVQAALQAFGGTLQKL